MSKYKFIAYSIFSFFLISCTNHYTKQLVKVGDNTLPILIKNVNIFNGKDSVVLVNKDIIIENGLIKTITSNFIPKNKKVFKTIDGKGKTIIPGFIDAHVHLSGSGSVPWENISANEVYNLAAYLYSGITTVYDLGGMASDLKKLATKVENNELLGPTIYHAHIPITVKNGHPIPLTKELLGWPLRSLVNTISPTIKKKEDTEKVITNYLKKEVDYVKIICDQIPIGSPEMSFDLLKSLINEAHKKGAKVFVHIGSPQNAVDATKAGADVLAHGVWRGKLTVEQATIIADSKIPMIYTLAAFQNVNSIHKGTYLPNEYDKLLVPETILNPVTGKNGLDVKNQKVMGAFFSDVTDKSPFWLDNFKLLKSKNVPMIIGTDSSLPGTYAGSTYFQEMDALKEFGLSNFEILTGATYLASKLFLDNPDFGIITEGKKANILLINGNPLEDLTLIKNPETIIKNGKIIVKVN